MNAYLNSTGVLLTLLGAWLVWRFLTVISFVDHKAYLQGQGVLNVPNPTPEDIKKYKWSVRLSKLGLGLVIAGSLLQVLSNHIIIT